jgi:hypothetical protein
MSSSPATSTAPSMAGPWYSIYSHYYTLISSAQLKHHQCVSLLTILQQIKYCITLHLVYFSSGASSDPNIAQESRNEVMLQHLLLLTHLKFLCLEPWFPIKHQAFKQLREYLLLLEPYIDEPEEEWDAGFTFLLSAEGQKAQMWEVREIYRILLGLCVEDLIRQLQRALEAQIWNLDVWTQPSVGQANEEAVRPASVLVQEHVIVKGLREKHLEEGKGRKLQKRRVDAGRLV